MTTRLYVGKVPYRARESDVEKFFKGFKCRNIILKNGFGFVEFDDYRDADDAAYELNGKELCGEKIIVEIARGMPRGRDRVGWQPPSSGSSRRSSGSSSDRYVSSLGRSEYRVLVENISSRVGYKELKEVMEEVGKVVFCEANVQRKNEGRVEYAKKEDMKAAIEKLNGKEWKDRKMKVVEDTSSAKSKSKSRSRSRSKERKNRSKSPERTKKSKEGSRERESSKRKSTSATDSAGEQASESKRRRLPRSRSTSADDAKDEQPKAQRKSRSPSAESDGGREHSAEKQNGNGKRDDAVEDGRSESGSGSGDEDDAV